MYSYLYRIQTIGLRFFTVYGPRGRRDMAPFIFLSAVHNGNPITVFDRDSTRDYTYVLDIVNGIMACIQKEDAIDEVYNLGSGCAVPISQLIGVCEELTGKKAVVDHSRTREEADMRHTLADISRARKELGYEPTVSLEEGMRLFYRSDFS
jgi:UDP-glucuronate 4-epimerase